VTIHSDIDTELLQVDQLSASRDIEEENNEEAEAEDEDEDEDEDEKEEETKIVNPYVCFLVIIIYVFLHVRFEKYIKDCTLVHRCHRLSVASDLASCRLYTR
jgi:hypothetical protein